MQTFDAYFPVKVELTTVSHSTVQISLKTVQSSAMLAQLRCSLQNRHMQIIRCLCTNNCQYQNAGIWASSISAIMWVSFPNNYWLAWRPFPAIILAILDTAAPPIQEARSSRRTHTASQNVPQNSALILDVAICTQEEQSLSSGIKQATYHMGR